MPIQIHLTDEAVRFGAKLRRAFMSGSKPKRYSPQNRTPFSGMISDFEANGTYVELEVIEPRTGRPRVSSSFYPLTENSDVQIDLERIGAKLSTPFPGRNHEHNYRRHLETLMEKIVAYYRVENRWSEARRAVKELIVKESFRKARETVAIDVPVGVWEKFATKPPNQTEDEVLNAMDEHVRGFCNVDEVKLKALVASKSAEVEKTERMMVTCDPRFAVLNLKAEIKERLSGVIDTNFEPFLVTLLNEDPPRRSRT